VHASKETLKGECSLKKSSTSILSRRQEISGKPAHHTWMDVRGGEAGAPNGQKKVKKKGETRRKG